MYPSRPSGLLHLCICWSLLMDFMTAVEPQSRSLSTLEVVTGSARQALQTSRHRDAPLEQLEMLTFRQSPEQHSRHLG